MRLLETPTPHASGSTLSLPLPNPPAGLLMPAPPRAARTSPGTQVRLHCSGCRSPLSSALRELDDATPPMFEGSRRVPPERLAWARNAVPRPGSVWRSFDEWTTDNGLCRFAYLDFGRQGRIALFNLADLAGAALPLRHRKGIGSGCCGPAWGPDGPNLGCNHCGAWVVAGMYGCEIPRFGVAWMDRVSLVPLSAAPRRPPSAAPPALVGPHRVACRCCGDPLTGALTEILAGEPPLYRYASGEAAKPTEPWGSRPRRGHFWRSRSIWPSREGRSTLGGVDFGDRAQVLMLHHSDLAAAVRGSERRWRSTGHDGPNLLCPGCSTPALTQVFRAGLPDFVAAHLSDVRLERV